MTRRRKQTVLVAGIIERHDNHMLIALPADQPADQRLWRFPRGQAGENESPEATIRHVARHELGVEIEIIVGQPPLPFTIDEVKIVVRYFFCGVVAGEASPGPYAELQWIPKIHLREYEFDEISQPVVDWILENG